MAESPKDVVRLRALVAYNGSQFHGFAEQQDVRTVAGDIRIALDRLFGEFDDFTCAGRTDTGVHAWGQVVHFDVAPDVLERYGLEKAQASLNKQLGPAIVFRSLETTDESFSARFSASARRYRYIVLNAELANPFLSTTAWWVPALLDVDAMNEAAWAVVGEHDFTSFCRRPKVDGEVSLVRRINEATWTRQSEDLLHFDIQGNAFCHQMVRSLTGMLVDIGRGKRRVPDMKAALDAKDRAMTAPLAPPHGLCLREVEYGTQ